MPSPRARPPAPLLRLLLLLAALAGQRAAASGVFELQILEFTNHRLRLESGTCCVADAGAGGPACARGCGVAFTLCLREYTAAAAGGAGDAEVAGDAADAGCSFGAVTSAPLGEDSFTLPESSAPLRLPFSFRWTRAFTLAVRAHAAAGTVERARWSGIVEPGAAWHTLRHAGARADLTYRVRVLCQPNYYNATCTTFCRARDDKFGHYTCSAPLGDKLCLPGWRGPNCEIPICKEGCHPEHGHCDLPGDCDCRPGWRGALCDECRPYPGCEHGYCNGSSWDCTCDTNWGGILCDQDLNYCGTHEPCRHGGTCENTAPDRYLCSCAEGFSGDDCERVDDPCAPRPCRRGVCGPAADPPGFRCACEPGWTGELCDRDRDDCESAPCRNAGVCRDLPGAFACACAPGWSGPVCADDVDECRAPAACANAAACENSAGSFRCACLPGWSGARCDINDDDCDGSCLNGATCIDLVGDYHCACASGYDGRRCERDRDDCASAPCRNGGECVDLPDAFRCICPAGYAGDRCELSSCSGRYCQDDRDHCAGSPCRNGAPCFSAQSDYYCHCGAGWSGKNCTRRAEPACVCLNGGTCGADGACACDAGWAGDDCGRRSADEAVSQASPASPTSPASAATAVAVSRCACPPPAVCAGGAGGPRCVCPHSDAIDLARCLDMIAAPEDAALAVSEAPPAEDCAGAGASWWWGCNVCWCGAGGAGCTRVWCGLGDCLRAVPCGPDQVCVPAAAALCLRPPCAAPGECRRVAGRRVEPAPAPPPPACRPGRPPRERCAAAALELARERLAPGAHAESACRALRRQLAAALARDPRAASLELALLCDADPAAPDLLPLALWVSADDGDGSARDLLRDALLALSEAAARRRPATDPLLGAALRLRIEADGGGAAAWWAGAGAALTAVALVAAGGAAWRGRRRRAARARRRRDEDKSTNLQNEENLRRFASGAAPASLYKPQNADARNNTRPPDECRKHAAAPPAPAPRPPPETLTVIV